MTDGLTTSQRPIFFPFTLFPSKMLTNTTATATGHLVPKRRIVCMHRTISPSSTLQPIDRPIGRLGDQIYAAHFGMFKNPTCDRRPDSEGVRAGQRELRAECMTATATARRL